MLAKTSGAADPAAAPTSARATLAAFSVGVTTISRRPCRSSRSRVAASVVVLPAPAAPSTTTSGRSPARAATDRGLAGIQPRTPRDHGGSSGRGPAGRLVGAGGEPGDQVGLDVEHRPRGPGPDVLGHPRPVQQRHAPAQGAGGEVLGQLEAHRRVGDDALGGDQPLDLTADVRGVPRRAAGGQPGQHPLDRSVPVQRADRGRASGATGPAGSR